MATPRNIPHRNRSHSGWWIYQEVEQWVSRRQKNLSPKSRSTVWENTRIIKAESREAAYKKAIRLGKKNSPSITNDGEWRFVGISMLLPIYEELTDGAEILWTDRGKMQQSKIAALIKTKKDLPVFDDSPESDAS
jgi:hypothetical protein